MKPLFISIAMLLSISTLAYSQTPVANNDEVTIRELEHKLSQALAKLDKPALVSLLADDFVSTSSQSLVTNKEQEISSFQLPDNVTIKGFDIEDMNVRVFESNTAIVTGRDILRLQYQGQDVDLPYRYTRVYIKRKGQWQLVAQHVTEVPKKQQK